MVEIVTLPKLGISDTGELVSWEKSVGDDVEEGELLAVLESDKASAEITAEKSGTLLTVYVDEGDELEIEPGRPIAAIGDEGESAPVLSDIDADGTVEAADADPDDGAVEAAAESNGGAATTATAAVEQKISPRARRYAEKHDIDTAGLDGTGPEGSVVEADVKRAAEAADTEPATAEIGAAAASADATEAPSTDVKATPRARQAARERGIDLSTVQGTGPQGAVTEADLDCTPDDLDAQPTAEPASDDALSASGDLSVTESRPLRGTRKTIANRLSQSAREKPHVMGTREISIEHLQRARERLAETADIDLSLNDLILNAVAYTLEDLPEFNAVFEENEHRLIEEINLGYAVDTEKGLVVPVLKNLQEKSLEELSSDRRALVSDVLEDEHSPADLQGGTFTVTNVGTFDLDVSYSIINPPQVAILALGRRKLAPVERDGDVEFETVVTFSLTIDHRVLDGADTGRFLERLADYLEYPGLMLEETL